MKRIRDDAARNTARGLNRPLPARAAQEEIGELVSTLNVTFKSLSSSFEPAARFSADASHQLKTPLTVLRLGIEELLADPDTSDRRRRRIDDLLNQIHRLTSIVEKLLLLSRADAGRLDLQRHNLTPAEVLSDFLDDITALTQEKGLRLETSIQATRLIHADPDSVAMIPENLMDNAIKYNRPGGSIKLAVTQTPNWTDIIIGNTSEPIPPERAAEIFERFFRASGGEEIPGSGLGLSIARELAQANHGELELMRSSAGWTEFRLRLLNAPSPELSDQPPAAIR